MSDLTARFAEIVGTDNLLTGDAIPENYCHDEALTTTPQKPACLPDYQVDLDNIYQYMGNPRMTGLGKLPVTFTPGVRSADSSSPVNA